MLLVAFLLAGCASSSEAPSLGRAPQNGDILRFGFSGYRVQVIQYEANWNPQNTRLLCSLSEPDIETQCRSGVGCAEVRPLSLMEPGGRPICYNIDWLQQHFTWEN